MTLVDCIRNQPLWSYCAIAAWFIQMGVHEGFHAHVAYRLGDPTADALGKRTINPLRHVEWGNLNSIFASVLLPIFTVFGMHSIVPMGMAWVPITPYNLSNPRRDHALIAIAGPIGNIVVCVVALAIHWGILRWFPEDRSYAAVETLCAATYLTSLAYGIFNLVPIPPIDGSRVLYCFLPHSARKVFESIEPFGFLIVIALFQLVEPLQDGFRDVLFFFGAFYR